MYKVLWNGEDESYWGSYFDEHFDVIRGNHNISNQIEDKYYEEDLIPIINDNNVEILIEGYDQITEKVLKECPSIKMILCGRDGPEENIDMDAATKYGVPVFSGGGRCAHGVSELTLALIFNMARPIIKATNHMRNNKWHAWAETGSICGGSTEVFGKTLSIVGLGKNGKRLAEIANGVGMHVIAYDPYVSKEVADALNVTIVDLDTAMKEGDYISILARVTKENKHMISKKQFDLMKPTACFINTGRSALVDEEALIDALMNNKIKMAALDVYDKEPLNDDSKLYDVDTDKLILTPHMAGLTLERVAHMYENLMVAYDKYLKGEKDIYNLYNKDVFESDEFINRGKKLFGIK